MQILFCALLGRPNVGKSSLINALLEQEIAIVSNKAQATREELVAIYNETNYQIIFIDTPGVHKAESKFGHNLNAISFRALEAIDLVVFLSPATQKINNWDQKIIAKIPKEAHKIALITKVDLENDEVILAFKAAQLKTYGFSEVFAISTKDPHSIKLLIKEIKKYAYEGEAQFDCDYASDITERFLAKETIREVAIAHLNDELPHNLAIMVETFEEKELPTGRQIKINAIVYVNKESQKGIVIGNQGSMIKLIGTKARQALKIKLDAQVHLFLKVKVHKNWINKEKLFKKLSY